MINEVYNLSKAMDDAGVHARSWHVNYKPIPNIRSNAPCVRVTISNGKVVELSSVPKELGAGLRKFGNNQGTYPCMNLASLYRITDETIAKSLAALRAEDINSDKIAEIKSWCQNNNWGGKFQNKYKNCVDKSEELMKLVPLYTPMQILAEEGRCFRDSMVLHRELELAVFRMLERRENVSLALQILFYQGKEDKKAEGDYGSLSVALESSRLIDMGIPAVSHRFVAELNTALLSAEPQKSMERNDSQELLADAFGVPFTAISEPMPTVKLAAGFDVTLRTMFHGNPCQTRYGRIEDASYPLSREWRKKLHAALNWLGSAEQENRTWIKTDRNEALFAYPAQLEETDISYTNMFRRPRETNISFTVQAKQFLQELRRGREPDTDSKANQIQLFIVRKIDKARTKVIYTRQTDAHELETCSEAWTLGCSNLPGFGFGKPEVPFPLTAADILNRFWKQNGELATDKFEPIPRYHGLELLMEPDLPVTSDLHMLSEKATAIGAFLGTLMGRKELYHPIWNKMKEMLALMGLMLYREGIRKEAYMESFPYLYGQLLKVSDELHAMYCRVERKGDLPLQLAGSSAYQAAAEAPARTLSVLGQRMNPYIAWARTYRTYGTPEKGKEGWRAKWLLDTYEDIVDRMKKVWRSDTRFSDEEKAQLFIGYLASFPKRKQEENQDETEQTEEAENI